jgi:8-oxo-dGTP pyrophosphatase MutT (NUDIX family)
LQPIVLFVIQSYSIKMIYLRIQGQICMEYWKPSTTVAAVIERDGKFLMVEENTREGLKLNQPAGHLDPGESLLDAVARESLEETAHLVQPVAVVGVYMSRYQHESSGTDVTYIRYAFACRAVAFDKSRPLDTGIVRAVWMSAVEIENKTDMHRSPLVMQTLRDYLKGKRFPLDLIYTHDSCIATLV